MTENGLFVLGELETQLHDILWAVHDGKNHGRSEGEENINEFPVTVGGQGPSDVCFFVVNIPQANATRKVVLVYASVGVYMLFR